MAGTWDELVQQIKERLDIVDVVSEQVVLKKEGTITGACVRFIKTRIRHSVLPLTLVFISVLAAVKRVIL